MLDVQFIFQAVAFRKKFFFAQFNTGFFFFEFLKRHYLGLISSEADKFILALISTVATLPVALSAARALFNKKVSIDLLASAALIVSLFNGRWASAVFINLMLVLR